MGKSKVFAFVIGAVVVPVIGIVLIVLGAIALSRSPTTSHEFVEVICTIQDVEHSLSSYDYCGPDGTCGYDNRVYNFELQYTYNGTKYTNKACNFDQYCVTCCGSKRSISNGPSHMCTLQPIDTWECYDHVTADERIDLDLLQRHAIGSEESCILRVDHPDQVGFKNEMGGSKVSKIMILVVGCLMVCVGPGLVCLCR
eukprot:TRINITY_DN67507_c5_g2_i1.p1 TRINITY_DN67507_c5_g2~~TRINITY_DN67507_c5_g2_i1.p1  ORF type:complete len:198 (-),score=6.20 TRINITY_DN67507_c5_g2_i1:83-676(-)